MRAAMLGFLDVGTRLAEAVRNNGSITLRGLDEDIDDLGPPLDLRGFREQFIIRDGGRRAHALYVYASPDFARIDPGAQGHLHDLAGRAVELNRYCQQASKDEALAVALQAPRLPPMVDALIVGAACFAAYFETLAAARPYYTANPCRAVPQPVLGEMREIHQRYRLMAADRMLAPEHLDALVPQKAWPLVGVETVWPEHAGERFINHVYFPAEQGRPLSQAAAQV